MRWYWIALLVVAVLVPVGYGVHVVTRPVAATIGVPQSQMPAAAIAVKSPPTTPAVTPRQPSDAEKLAEAERQLALQRIALTQLQQKLAPPVSAPPPPTVHGEVSGAAWVTKLDGTSDILRGLHVDLLPDRMSSTPVRGCLSREPNAWQRFVVAMRSTPGDLNDYRKEGLDVPGDLYQTKLFADRRAKSLAASQSVILNADVECSDAFKLVDAGTRDRWDAFADSISEGETLISELDAAHDDFAARLQRISNKYRLLAASDVRPSNTLTATAMVLASATTGVDGRFIIHNIIPGSYCLHAVLDQPSGFAEWAVPVKVETQTPVSVDLSNENATAMNITHPGG